MQFLFKILQLKPVTTILNKQDKIKPYLAPKKCVNIVK